MGYTKTTTETYDDSETNSYSTSTTNAGGDGMSVGNESSNTYSS